MTTMPLKYSETGQITGCRAESVEDAKLCIKELKLKKKDFALQKKEVAAEIAQIRDKNRSTKVASRAVKGSGFLATMVKTSNTIGAINVDGKVRALETKKASIDETINQFDRAIMGLERYILDAAK